MSKVKLKDIADKAGVSLMTVSRVMNNEPKVGAKTRQRIEALAKELNYSPNVAARQLSSSKSYFIGIVCEHVNANYVSKFLVGALKQCRTNGYHIVIDETAGEIGKALSIVKELIHETKVDGMILLPPLTDIPEVLALLKEVNIPFVRIAPDIDLLASAYVCMDDYQAAYDITEHLVKSGHKRIAHIIGNENQGVSRLRYQGYLDALRSHRLLSPPEYIEQGDFTYKSGLVAAEKLLSLTELPDAIFASNDEMAAAAMSVAHKNRLDIPEQISVVGFDDTELASTVWPRISTIRQPLKDMAILAIKLLTEPENSLTNNPSVVKRHILPYQVCLRESSK
ncbi:LacI family DNA-binding transcriptional regulator [Paraglaciecola aquimarina]|uniref:LacI family DNA-binding transcriptional regulator n=1 Tax=Paraglaciecola aquimarina TaxID=1235557 RepID=A0ABU3SRU9_9ALTE|nr:LacI family DNA-binding transcriptional regulator [Paraglaciecola aquimarina]MDU0352741.1 LacI family DNA-binding transcriptional regulator [Paraglaciecola aquimarina]